MKLYIKQKVFSLIEKFTVKDSEGEDKYKIQGKFSFFMKKFYIYDTKENEVAYIEQKFSFPLIKFKVFVKGEEVAEIVKEFLRQKYKISEKNWQVNGNFFAHDYTILDLENGAHIANIKKEWMTWGDSYVIDIEDSKNEIPVLAIVIVIDVTLANR